MKISKTAAILFYVIARRKHMPPFLKSLAGMGVVLVFALTMGLPAKAAEYPEKPITLIVPFTAGGATDATGRALASSAKKYLGQPIIIENKGGGGGTVGASLLVTKKPDGYTLGILPPNAVSTAWHTGTLNFNPLEEFTHIIRVTSYVYGIVVRADAPWKTIQDFVQHVQKNPQKVTYGSPGVGAAAHLFMEEFAILAKMQLIHMPYKGTTETTTALLGGHVDAVSDSSA